MDSRKRIAKLMKEAGWVCKTIKKFKAKIHSKHNKPAAKNVLNREFESNKPDKAYVGDITYISTREGWLHCTNEVWTACSLKKCPEKYTHFTSLHKSNGARFFAR